MSGVVTPILDTLLHQVLGKRVDAQEARSFPEPVKPLMAGRAPGAVHSDSRLNSERTGVALPQAPLGKASSQSTPGLQAPLAPASTTTHFSSAARTIADILVKFPAPPSVIRPQAPLLPLEASTPTAQQIATHLQGSIDTSGLFYESQLARWYRGEVARTVLELQPQMQLHMARASTAPPIPEASARLADALSTPRSGAEGAGRATTWVPAGPAATSQAPNATPAPLHPGAFAGASPTERAAAGGPAVDPRISSGATQAARATSMEPLDNVLQGVVRHQLELLVTPTLRWEGDLWTGVFMALMVQIPETLHEQGGDKEKGRDEEDDPVWHSQLSLQFPRLGTLDVQLHLRTAFLGLVLESDNGEAIAALSEGRETLVERLRPLGFDDIRVTVLAKHHDRHGTGSES